MTRAYKIFRTVLFSNFSREAHLAKNTTNRPGITGAQPSGKRPGRQYIVMPAFGFQSDILAQSSALRTTPGAITLSAMAGRAGTSATRVQVVHSLHENGPKLVEMTEAAELNLRHQQPGLKIIPLVRYLQMRSDPGISKAAAGPGTTGGISLKVVNSGNGKAVKGARVLAFTSYRYREGAEGSTNAAGICKLALTPGARLERLYVFGPARYWGHYSAKVVLNGGEKIEIEAIDPNTSGLILPTFYGALPATAGAGIVVGVVDSGVDKAHPNLPNVIGGMNAVTDETLDDAGAVGDWGPAATEGDHGTHVAGIIGMRPTAEVALRGVAAGVSLRSYRVFPNAGGGASNYDIMKAIDRAVSDGCHIINLSLGGGEADEGVRAAIGSALDRGTIVIAAAGNDGRGPVSYPAAWPSSVAVAAMGLKGSFPANSNQSIDIDRPYGSPKRDAFVAAFSNFGPQISLTGPGVGVVSTLPGGAFGAMSGTSMACPAVAGYAAYLLSTRSDILGKLGDERSRLLRQALEGGAAAWGFGRDYEGFGMPTVPGTS